MNRNWIVLVLAIVSLASCSVEKRVYQPGYHIEWNHFAKQDANQDVSQDAMQDASRDVSQDLSENLEIDVAQDAPLDVAQDAAPDFIQDASQDASRNVSKDVSLDVSRTEKLEQIIQAVSPIQNISAKSESKLGQSIDSDLEMVLFIVLALFLPALTIFLLEGFSKNFWLALLLMILAFALPLPFFLKLMIQAIATVLAIAVVFHYL
jgi:uncharacterized membrane protein YqaE (UPF0057 family)